ncbi:MAG: hypothetical protein F4X34_02165 [Chloroflexi bacterium]|nr:hypothetical protein [Chloroflexota bacterium]
MQLISELRVSPFKQFVYMFVATVVIQTLHMVEHVAQVFQKFVLDYSYAHGLIGSLDLEQVHFTFNLMYLGALIYVTLGWLNFGRRVCFHEKMLGGLLIATVVVQGYHMVEHSARLVQFLNTGLQGTPGLLGAHFDGVVFHALMNTVVYLPAVVVFVCSGMHKQIFKRDYSVRWY